MFNTKYRQMSFTLRELLQSSNYTSDYHKLENSLNDSLSTL